MTGLQVLPAQTNQHSRGRASCVLALCLTLTACSTNQTADVTVISGAVTKVHDGDSIHITPANQKRQVIRLAGIDAPELKQANGIASRDKLRSLLTGRNAKAHCHKIDRYKRHVCTVFLDETDIGLTMVQSGYAWHYTDYQSEQTPSQRRQYKRAQVKSMRAENGIWSQASPIPPWEFRQ